MGNFTINNPEQEAYYEPMEVEPHLYSIGTHVDFQTIGDTIKSVFRIPVHYA